MIRDYKYVDKYLDILMEQIYPQPQDPGHTAWAIESIEAFMSKAVDAKHVLDAGCGEAFCQDIFESYGASYVGICLGEDFRVAIRNEKTVAYRDFSFTKFDDNSFDFIYSRHSLEHSPMPLLTLMEWHRITSKYVGIVVPSPEHWKYVGQNHYYVLHDPQWRNLFDVAGFDVTYFNIKRQNMTPDPINPEVEIEYWYLLEKKQQDQSKAIG